MKKLHFKNFGEEVNNERIQGFYVLSGHENFLKNIYLTHVKAFQDHDVICADSIDEALEYIHQPSIFSLYKEKPRVVIVNHPESLKHNHGDLKAFVETNRKDTIILNVGVLPKNSKIRNLNIVFVDFPEARGTASWIVDEIDRRRERNNLPALKIDKTIAEEIEARCRNNMEILNNEIDKISRINKTKKEVEDLVLKGLTADEKEFELWEQIDNFITATDGEEELEIAASIFKEWTDNNVTVFQMIPILYQKYRALFITSLYYNLKDDEIQKKALLKWYEVKNSRRIIKRLRAKGWSDNKIKLHSQAALETLNKIEKDVKIGGRDQDVAFKLLFIELKS